MEVCSSSSCPRGQPSNSPFATPNDLNHCLAFCGLRSALSSRNLGVEPSVGQQIRPAPFRPDKAASRYLLPMAYCRKSCATNCLSRTKLAYFQQVPDHCIVEGDVLQPIQGNRCPEAIQGQC